MSQCKHMKDGLGTTTWSWAWIIEALLWINQKHECTVQALVVWSCDWVGGRDGGAGSRAREPRMRRMGGFQCPSLFASASGTFSSHAASCDCGGVWICASSSSSSSPCPCEVEGWDVVVVTVPRWQLTQWWGVVIGGRELDRCQRWGSRTCGCFWLQWSPPGTLDACLSSWFWLPASLMYVHEATVLGGHFDPDLDCSCSRTLQENTWRTSSSTNKSKNRVLIFDLGLPDNWQSNMTEWWKSPFQIPFDFNTFLPYFLPWHKTPIWCNQTIWTSTMW